MIRAQLIRIQSAAGTRYAMQVWRVDGRGIWHTAGSIIDIRTADDLRQACDTLSAISRPTISGKKSSSRREK